MASGTLLLKRGVSTCTTNRISSSPHQPLLTTNEVVHDPGKVGASSAAEHMAKQHFLARLRPASKAASICCSQGCRVTGAMRLILMVHCHPILHAFASKGDKHEPQLQAVD